MCFECLPQFSVGNGSVFEHLSPAFAHFLGIERFQHGQVQNNSYRCGKAADIILQRTKVHAGFSSQGGIGHGQQAGRHKCERHTALVYTGSESPEVTNHAAAHADQQILAGDLPMGQVLPDFLCRGQGFLCFTGFENQCMVEMCMQFGKAMPQRVLVAECDDAHGTGLFGQGAQHRARVRDKGWIIRL